MASIVITELLDKLCMDLEAKEQRFCFNLSSILTFLPVLSLFLASLSPSHFYPFISRGMTPLMIACARGNTKIVETLVNFDANIHEQDKKGTQTLSLSLSLSPSSCISFSFIFCCHIRKDLFDVSCFNPLCFHFEYPPSCFCPLSSLLSIVFFSPCS